MQARYLVKGDVIILQNGKRCTVNSVTIKRGRVIAQTSGGRLTFKPDQQVIID